MTIAELLVKIGVSVDGAKRAEKEIKKVEAESEKLGKTAKKSTKQAATGFQRFAQRVKKGAAQIKTSAAKIKKSLGGVVKTIGVVVGAMTGGTAAVIRFVDVTTAAIDKQNKFAAATGISVEELQRLAFVAQQSGANEEDLSRGLRRLDTNLTDIANGGGQLAADALADLGLSVSDLSGLSAQARLGVIGDALNQLGSDTERVTLSAKILGEEAGPRLQSLLRSGSKGIDDLASSARVLTQDQADEASSFQDLLGEVRGEITFLVRTASVELLPMVREVIESFRDWLDENEELIKQNLPKLLKTIAVVFDQVLDQIERFLKFFGAAYDQVVAFDRYMSDNFGPTWENIKDILSRVVNPIDAIGNAMRTVIELLDQLGAKFPRLKQAAEYLESFGMVQRKAGSNVDAGAAGEAGKLLAAGVAFVRESGGIEGAGKRLKASAAEAQQSAEVAQLDARMEYLEGKYNARTLSKSEADELVAKFGYSPGQAKKGIKRMKRAGGGKGGGGKEPVSAVTFDEVFSALLTGRGEELTSNIKGLANKTPSTSAIKPTVAIDFFNFVVTQTISGVSDPVEAGRRSAAMIKQEFRRQTARAASSVQSNAVR